MTYDKKTIDAIREWVASCDPPYFIVLSPNKHRRYGKIPPAWYENRITEIDEWHKRADRYLLKKRWAKNPNRTGFIAFPEIGPLSGLLHFNLALNPPDLPADPGKLWKAYHRAWHDVLPDGSIEIKPVAPGTIEEMISYDSKALWTELGTEGWCFSREQTPRLL
jgi:hypothetical protein